MAYNPTEWATGDVITAQKLNKMEQGIAGAGLQLYGPYYASASNPEAIDAGYQGFVTLDTLEDVNGITVTYPATSATLLLEFVSTGARNDIKVLLAATGLPSYNGDSWSDCTVTVVNIDQSAKKIYPSIGFYSTVEFPQE